MLVTGHQFSSSVAICSQFSLADCDSSGLASTRHVDVIWDADRLGAVYRSCANLVSNYPTTTLRLPRSYLQPPSPTTLLHYGHPQRRASLGDNCRTERRHRDPHRLQGYHRSRTCEGSVRVHHRYPNPRQGEVPLPVVASAYW